MARSKAMVMYKKGYTQRILNCWNVQTVITDFKDSEVLLSGRSIIDPFHLRWIDVSYRGNIHVLHVKYALQVLSKNVNNYQRSHLLLTE